MKKRNLLVQMLSLALSCTLPFAYPPGVVFTAKAAGIGEISENTNDIDEISGHTGDMEEVLESADEVYGYGTMTMTYEEFYLGDSVDHTDIDAVSSATTSKNTMFLNMDATVPTEDGYQIRGVKDVVVKVMESASEELKNRVQFYEEGTPEPKQYKLVDKNGIGSTEYHIVDEVTDAQGSLNTNSHWGDYEISILEASTSYLRNTRSEYKDKEETQKFEIGSEVQGVIFETAKGKRVAAAHLQNIWIQTYKTAFSVKESGGNTGFDQLVGETITKITYIMPTETYVYHVSSPSGIYIKPAYPQNISGSFDSAGKKFTLQQELTDITNAKIMITYREGRNTKTLLETELSGKEYLLTEAIPENTYVTVTISCDQYADITVNYPMMQWQREQLQAMSKEAAKMLEKLEDSTLNSHKKEADELLADKDATAAQADELISELTSLLNAADETFKTAVAELSKAVDDARALKQFDYTEVSWAALETALSEAASQLEAPGTWKEIKEALSNVTKAVENLVKAEVNTNTGTNTNNNSSTGINNMIISSVNSSSNNMNDNVSTNTSDNTKPDDDAENHTDDENITDQQNTGNQNTDNNTGNNTSDNQQNNNIDDNNSQNNTEQTSVVKKGDVSTVGSNRYKITKISANGKGTVKVVAPKNKKIAKVTIPDTVTIDGVVCKVTAIQENAYKDCTQITSIKIGENITEIGKNAFFNASKCKNITIASKKLTKVGKNALKGISDSAKIKVPASKLKEYKKLLKGKGQSSKVKIIKMS